MKTYFYSIGTFFIFLLIFCKIGFSQISVSVSFSSDYKIGIGYNFSERIWSELRLSGEEVFSDISSELVLCNNIVKRERYSFYSGIGVLVNFDYGGLIIPFGTQFCPIEGLKNLSLHFELLPTFIVGKDIQISSAIGVRYLFNLRRK